MSLITGAGLDPVQILPADPRRVTIVFQSDMGDSHIWPGPPVEWNRMHVLLHAGEQPTFFRKCIDGGLVENAWWGVVFPGQYLAIWEVLWL